MHKPMLSETETAQMRWELYNQVVDYREDNDNFHEIVANWIHVKTVAIPLEKDLRKRCDQFDELNIVAAQARLSDEDRAKNAEKIQKHMQDLLADLGLLA